MEISYTTSMTSDGLQLFNLSKLLVANLRMRLLKLLRGVRFINIRTILSKFMTTEIPSSRFVEESVSNYPQFHINYFGFQI